MARKNSADLAKTKQKILEVGLSLLEQKGYNATGIQEIATSSGMPKGSFYNYFSSKEDFGVEVIRYYAESGIANLNKMLEEATLLTDSFQALPEAFLLIAENYRAATVKKGCLLGNLAAEISEASEECRRELELSVQKFKTVIAQRVEAGQLSGKVRTDLTAASLADLIWDCWQGSLLRMKIDNSVEPVSHSLQLLFQNILPGK